MSADPLFTVQCAGCGRTGKTSRLHELWTVEYCPDCRDRLAQVSTDSEGTTNV